MIAVPDYDDVADYADPGDYYLSWGYGDWGYLWPGFFAGSHGHGYCYRHHGHWGMHGGRGVHGVRGGAFHGVGGHGDGGHGGRG